MTKPERILLLLFLGPCVIYAAGFLEWLLVGAIGGACLAVYYLLIFPLRVRQVSFWVTIPFGVLMAGCIAACFVQNLDYSAYAYDVFFAGGAALIFTVFIHLQYKKQKIAVVSTIITRLLIASAVLFIQIIAVAVHAFFG